jgi:hypothetical protein
MSRGTESGHEFAGVDLEAGGEFEQVVQAEVSHSALDLSDEGPVES